MDARYVAALEHVALKILATLQQAVYSGLTLGCPLSCRSAGSISIMAHQAALQIRMGKMGAVVFTLSPRHWTPKHISGCLDDLKTLGFMFLESVKILLYI